MKEPTFYPVKVLNISLSNYGFVIFLKRDKDDRVLPICIGAAEVNSISAALSKQHFPRPSSHTLFKNILTELGSTIVKIQVTELKEGTFYAKLFMETKGEVREFDSRPSDAIALALRYNAPMFVHKNLFTEAGVDMNETREKMSEPQLTPLEALKQSLAKAIQQEKYEEAVRLKEKIQQMELDELMNN